MQTADLMDLYQDELQSCELQFKNYGGRGSFWGPCRTVRCKDDNVILRKLLEEQGNDQVLIVDGGGSFYAALFGDIVADIGQRNNWAGVVIYGVIRDSIAIKDIDIGVKALGTNPRKCEKMGTGEKDIPISFGGIKVRPGDWVYCDEDGFLIAKRELPV